MINLSQDGLLYELNEENHTATIVGSKYDLRKIIISRSVKYQQNEYIIISIGKLSFAYHNNIRSIKFSKYSELQIIDDKAFSHSSLKSIEIPSSVTRIGVKAFSSCQKLTKIGIPIDSKLEIIEKEAFFYCSIKSFFLPPHVKTVSESCFNSCSYLKIFTIPENSELERIDKDAFSWSPIDNLYFPSNLNELGEDWCCSTTSLEKIEISPDNKKYKFYDDEKTIVLGKSDLNSDLYDSLVLVSRFLENIRIPSFVKYINTACFSGCESLYSVEFEKDSNLTSIEVASFAHSSIKNIRIPPKVVEIKKNAFFRCQSLIAISFEENSQCKSIGKHAFSFSSLQGLLFPENLQELAKEWCYYLSNLTCIYVHPNNENFFYINSKILIGKSDPNINLPDSIFFARRDIDEVVIPSFIRYIRSCAFSECVYLESVEFAEDSELEKIENYAFYKTPIKKITIPKHVKVIEEHAFNRCDYLESVEFHEDSELVEIGSFAFSLDSLEHFYIPSKLEVLKRGFGDLKQIIKSISVSPENKNFAIINDNILIGKNDPKSDCLDAIFFVKFDETEQITIPSYIKYIKFKTFASLIYLKEITFEKDSNLVLIGSCAFENISIRSLQLPASLKTVKRMAFQRCVNLFCVEFLGDDLFIGCECFNLCIELRVVSFPNAHSITFCYDSFDNTKCSLFILPGGVINKYTSHND